MYILAYADNLVLLAERGISSMLERLKGYLQKKRIAIEDKSKIMRCSKGG